MSTSVPGVWPGARRSVVAFGLIVALAGAASAQEKKPDTGNQDEIRALLTATDEAATGKSTGSLALKWEQHHFIKSHGDKTYVPFTVSFDGATFAASTPVGLYLRVAKRGELPPTSVAAAANDADKKKKKDKKDDVKGTGSQVDARHQYPFEDVFFIDIPPPVAGQAQLLRRAFAVSPGDYDVYVALKEKAAGATASPKIGVVKQELTVPSLDGNLTTSSVIMAAKVDVLPTEIASDRQAENPYTFGAMKITPSLDNKFTTKDELDVIFWIYGAGVDAATKKPHIEVEYNFHQKTTDGEKFFNKTDPQVMNAETLPAQFDLAAGHQLPGSLAVPLASFPAGEYRLELKVTDKTSGQAVSRESNFSIAAP
ncbi:MAG: hypothetical protein JJE40_15545 [Vicinamibacteria bacterium]|nr:hypothetical protein [Vicinamibacteria bacterium]